MRGTPETLSPQESTYIPLDTIGRTATTYTVTPPQYHFTQQPTKPVVRTWKQYVNSLNTSDRTICQSIKWKTNNTPLWEHLLNHKEQLYLVSDGSYRAHSSTYAWILGTNTNVLVNSSGQVTGNPVNIQRAESAGLWTWLVFLQHYISYYGIRIAAKLHCYCDNQTVVRHSCLLYTSPSPRDGATSRMPSSA